MNRAAAGTKASVWKRNLQEMDEKGLRRRLRRVSGPQGRELVIDGKRALNFSSNDYLGLAGDPRLVEAAAACLREQGVGAGASRLVCGNFSAHQDLEEALARFKGTEKCLLFSSGYMANVGIISGLFDREDIIYADRLNHASLIDGILLSRAEFKRYPHRDMEALEELLKAGGRYRHQVIVTDTVFSMDGDLAPLDRIAALAEKYGCLIMVDEAHALGVVGPGGRGAVEHFGLAGRIDIQMGTLSKAVGAFGAYCCGSSDLIDVLIQKARSFVFTTGMPPAIAAAALRGLQILESDHARREQLLRNAHFLRGKLNDLGLDTMNSETPIIPVLVGDAGLAVEVSSRLLAQGILAVAVRPPTVPANTARLRITVTAQHTREDLDVFLKAIEKVARDTGLIP